MARDEGSYHHGNLRRALLDAALAMIAERGSLDFTMRELSRRADVTHNAPYRHFEGKADLLAALAEEGFVLLRERSLRARPAHVGDPRGWVRALGASYVAFAVEHPHHFRLMFGESMAEARATHPHLAESAEASFALLKDGIEACRAQGILRRDLSTRDLGLVAWSLVHGLASLLVAGQIPGGGARVPTLAREMATVFFEGALLTNRDG